MKQLSNFFSLKIFTVLSFIGLASMNVFGQNHYDIIYDVNYSSVCGAENLLSLHKATSTFENKYLKASLWDEKKCFSKLEGITYRLAKTIFVDNVIDHLTILTQHEIFGHGSRYREFGFIDNSFHLSLVPPYGDGHGFAQTGQLKSPRISSKCENVSRVTGGDEANSVLSQHLIGKWLLRGALITEKPFCFLNLSTISQPIFFLRNTAKNSQLVTISWLIFQRCSTMIIMGKNILLTS